MQRCSSVCVLALVLISTLSILTVSEARAEQYGVAWSRNISAATLVNGLGLTPTGGVVIAGETYAATFGPHAGNYDSFVASYTDGGEFVWGAQFGGQGTDGANVVAVDRFGNAIAGGLHQSDPYVSKYDANGNHEWFNGFGSPQNFNDATLGITTDGAGNIYAAGQTSPLPTTFLNKYDASGATLWSKAFRNTQMFDLLQDPASDDLYLNGNLPGSNGRYFIKVDAQGNELWRRLYGGGLPNKAIDAVVDAAGNVYLTGQTENSPVSDLFVAKFNANGDLLWRRDSTSAGREAGMTLALDQQGNVFVAGLTTGSLLSDNLGYEDAVLLKYDTNGNLLASLQFGGTSNDSVTSIAVDALGNVYVGGTQRNTDGWLVKLTPIPEPSTVVLGVLALVGLFVFRRNH